MPRRGDFHKVVIGRSEVISFLEHEIMLVPAKTDTGAYRSAVHARNIVLDEEKGMLSFDLLSGHPVCGDMGRRVETTHFSEVWVASSFGHRERRYDVKFKVRLGPKVFFAKFSLADRGKKIYPILLGRTLLNRRFLVDSAESAIDRIDLKEKYNIDFPQDEEEGRPYEDSDSI